jgi:hypothetical protein
MTPRVVFALVACCAVAAGGRAADPPPVPTADLDRVAVEVLKDLHNRGADLYNAADAVGAMRLYEGTLRTVVPFLTHRPKVQKAIEDGLADALKLDGPKAQAFRLHEVIDAVRTDLKAAIKADAEGKPSPPPDPKKPTDPPPEKTPDPTPPQPPAPTLGSVSGVLTLDGKPLKGDVTLVSLTLPQPRVFTAAAAADGKFAFPAELPPATYAGMVTAAPGVPARYLSTMTSGLEVAVKAGPQTADVKLQSK